MPRRLFFALLLLVAAPMVLLGWLSASAVRANQDAAKDALATLLESQLDDTDRVMKALFARYADRLRDAFEEAAAHGEPVVQTLRRLRRQSPIVRQGIFVDADGQIRFPTASDTVGADAIEVAAALPGIVDARPMVRNRTDQPVAMSKSSRAATKVPVSKLQIASQPVVESEAWQQWYLANGSQVLYWRLEPDGTSIGVLLERSRWIADLISEMPDTPAVGSAIDSPSRRSGTPIGSIALVDEANRTVYHWGKSDELALSPLVSREVSPPLASWTLSLHVDQSLLPAGSNLPVYISLGGIALLLLLVGLYVLTAVTRQINEAKNRVSFAGQVSHELRTPLTNIRLYTELAESDLQRVAPSDAADSVGRRLEVIDHESRRLQRLVNGVLEMIRPRGKRVGVRKQPTDLRGLIDGIAEQFEPVFRSSGLTLQTVCAFESPVLIDPDVVELVLVNLLSNVEKYVPSGGRCEVRCERGADKNEDQTLRIVVDDDGPGINTIHRVRVFRPFERIDDSISAPSGTGIGLTIARKAARRHGGELVLLSESPLGGAAFELTLPIGESFVERKKA